MYETRIKWAELWYRALGYNEDYWYYCFDMREFGYSKAYENHKDYLHIKKAYDIFGDMFVGVGNNNIHADIFTEGMLKNWQTGFDNWFNKNKNKIIPEKLESITYINDVVLNKYQPSLDLFQVASWDSENNQKSVEKLLDVFQMQYIELRSKKDILIRGLLSGKECWQQDYDKYLKDNAEIRVKEYNARLNSLKDKIAQQEQKAKDKLIENKKLEARKSNIKLRTQDIHIPRKELMTPKKRLKFANSFRALRKKGIFKFNDVRGLWEAQFRDRDELYYAIIDSAITGQFPSSFVDLTN